MKSQNASGIWGGWFTRASLPQWLRKKEDGDEEEDDFGRDMDISPQ